MEPSRDNDSRRRDDRPREDRDRDRDRRDKGRDRSDKDKDRGHESRHSDSRASPHDVKERRHRHRSRSPRLSRSHRRHREEEDSESRGRRERNRSGDRDKDKDRDSRRHRPRDRERERERDNGGGGEVQSKAPLPSQADSFALTLPEGEAPEKPKEQPNWGNSGALAAASNSVAQADGSSITLKYHEPAEARKPPPRDDWKLFVFKGSETIDTVPLSMRSCWLVGRETAVVDLLAEHPSVSKQHAVIQFRYTEKRNEFGDKVGKVKPYLIDLESANGTVLNDGKVPASRYLELRDKDVLLFGDSTREYVIMLAPRT